MSSLSSHAKIEFLLEMIEKIEQIIQRHGGIVRALEDFEGQMALLMGIAQIGETLKKLDDTLVVEFNLTEDRDGAYYTRNYIVHDYEGVDLGVIENLLRIYLPELKNKLLMIQNTIAKNNS